MQSNPVVEEVLKIQAQWGRIKVQFPEAKLFRWVGHKMELQMVDAFVKRQMSQAVYTDDVFFLFVHSFSQPDAYGQYMIGDLNKYIDGWYSSKDNTFKKEKWVMSTPQNRKADYDVPYFIDNINSFFDYLNLPESSFLVISLTPERIENLAYFQEWIGLLVDADNLHPQIKVMIYDNAEPALFKTIAQRKDEKIIHVKPEIDMERCLQQTIEKVAKDKKDPAAEFQKLLITASFLLGKSKTKAALTKTDKALFIAQKYSFKELEVTVRVLRSNIFSSLRKTKDALKEIDLAIVAADKDKNLNLQTRMLKGTLLIADNDYKKATDIYKSCIPFIDKKNDLNWNLEVHRIYGFCARKIKDKQTAWDAYMECLNAGKMMDKEQAKLTMLAYAGDDMLQICTSFGHEQDDIYKEFETILGENWQDTVKKPKKNRKVKFPKKQN